MEEEVGEVELLVLKVEGVEEPEDEVEVGHDEGWRWLKNEGSCHGGLCKPKWMRDTMNLLETNKKN